VVLLGSVGAGRFSELMGGGNVGLAVGGAETFMPLITFDDDSFNDDSLDNDSFDDDYSLELQIL
jgi:hypothetical protein